MTKFIQLSFLFDVYPTEIHLPTLYIIVGGFVFCFLLGIFMLFLASKKSQTDKIIAKLFSKIANWGLWIGVIGSLITFFRYELTPYLGMRIWTFACLLFALAWLLLILKYALVNVPRQKKLYQQKKEFEKYLPK